MNENGVRVSYERLFNMGNFEHEKYTISKDVDCGTEFEAFKELSLKIVEFEADLVKYRALCEKLPNLIWSTKHINSQLELEKVQRKLEIIQRRIQEFKEKHKPVFKECKCFYCTHPDEYNDNDEDR